MNYKINVKLLYTKFCNLFFRCTDAPDGSPNLTLEKSQYSIGDILKGNCTSPPSVPSANITWYINDKQVGSFSFIYFVHKNCKVYAEKL